MEPWFARVARNRRPAGGLVVGTARTIKIDQPGQRAEGVLTRSLGLDLDEDDRKQLQHELDRINERERLAEAKAGLVQLH